MKVKKQLDLEMVSCGKVKDTLGIALAINSIFSAENDLLTTLTLLANLVIWYRVLSVKQE